ncbi:hypothetical protein QNI19_23090 [Cytophagaceae bacterium DM2B3-1]|uniref:Outer membrane protein beta-barrel domain-containing protein n=1 Tax=Xanthocytophaga flava TaxID=3048013 RepID=A0ABT7CQ18_9BACT|nr:hypothetical protein [Xanthocytophaga flavus]MDJ1495840.1 hypothetical protein [Xanthocytophaga flavus]
MLLILQGGSYYTYAQSAKLRNISELQVSYQSSAIAHQIPLEYIHSFGKHGIIVGLRYLIIKGGYSTVDDPPSVTGFSLGYQYLFDTDPHKVLRPFVSYRFLYNPSLIIRTLSPSTSYTPQQQTITAGIKLRHNSGLYSFMGVGVLHTLYIVTTGAAPGDRSKFTYSLQVGIGYAYRCGKHK